MRLLPLLLFACSTTPDDPGVDQDADTDADTDTDTDTDVDADLNELRPYSAGSCPVLSDGHNDFASGELTRDVRIDLPADPEGAPVVFAWHWLGGTANQMADFSGVADWADSHGAVIVAPESRGLPYEWDTYESSADSPDLVLFDDLLTCLHEQYGIDRARVYSTGMSAGALWTVTLTRHRSAWLAASAPLSGGATTYGWTPADPTPMLLTWGGSSDTYGSYSFEQGTMDLADQLDGNDQFYALCEHDRGHLLPPEIEYVWTFFDAHPRGVGTPWADGLPGTMPDWCSLP